MGNLLRHRLATALWLTSLQLVAGTARAETLKYEVSLFGVEVGEVTAKVKGDTITLDGETSGALTLFFPAQEKIVIETRKGVPFRATRSFEHGGKKGVWTASLEKGKVRLVMDDQRGKRTKTFKIPEQVYDPATAIQKLRTEAPAKKVALMIFGADGIYRFELTRISRKPLHYRGTMKLQMRLQKARKKQGPPAWLAALGLGKGASARPEVNVWLTDDTRHLPTKVRWTDQRGALQLTLTEPALKTASE